MALVEVDENDWNASKQVVQSMQNLLNSPKTRRDLLRLQKQLNPHLVIPEIDSAEPVLNEVTAVSKRLEEMQKRLDDADEARKTAESRGELMKRWNTGRSNLRNSGYTDEGLDQVEKFMEEHGLADHKIAAAAFEKLHPAPEPVRSSRTGAFDLFGPQSDDKSSEYMKALMSDPESNNALDGLINETLRSVRGR